MGKKAICLWSIGVVVACALLWSAIESSTLFRAGSAGIRFAYVYTDSDLVRGVVVDGSGRAIPGVDVGCDDLSGGSSADMDANGFFSFAPDDTISIDVTAAGKKYSVDVNRFTWRRLNGVFLVIVINPASGAEK